MGLKATKSQAKTSLSDAEIKLLAHSTHFNEEQLRNYYNGFVEDNPSACLTKKDFIKMFRQFHPIEKHWPKAEKYCEYVFNAFDEDGSGIIKFSEFIVALSVASFGELKEKIQLAFKIFDLDKNRVVDRDEMFKVIQSLYDMTGVPDRLRVDENSPKSRVNTIMKRADKNGDDVLSLDEFIDGCITDESVRQVLVDPLFNC